ncbi:Lrp/AsnC family transcriptional regulator [Tsukamurella soli]|uniref:Lrp/AsnC family transcriptional regulator n=1 Tax=Tsukamurella soli TaxID=644556 RepID=A0ABP8JIG3_9ACTN
MQIDGRASWRAIALALDAPERTVTRRGTALLSDGTVRVSGLAPRGDSLVVRVRCTPGSSRLTARALAAREDTTFAYLVTGSTDCVAEVIAPPDTRAQFLLEALPTIPGVVSMTTAPVLRYLRTVHEWRPNLLTEAEQDRLGAITPPPIPPRQLDRPTTTPRDRAIIKALHDNGRCTYEELGRLVGVSEPTARRRVEALRRDGQVYIRSVVDARALGYSTSVMLWIRTPPAQVDATAAALVESPYVRYAAALMGNDQIVAELALPSLQGVYDVITSAPWSEFATALDTCLVIQAVKTSGVVVA